MLARKDGRWTGVALGLGILAGGLPLWPIPYSEVSMTQPPLPFLWAISAGLIAAYVAFRSPLGPVRSAVTVGLGVPIAVLLRVIVEVLQDPSAHNLWPFELGISVVVVALPVSAGAYVGHLIKGSMVRRADR